MIDPYGSFRKYSVLRIRQNGHRYKSVNIGLYGPEVGRIIGPVTGPFDGSSSSGAAAQPTPPQHSLNIDILRVHRGPHYDTQFGPVWPMGPEEPKGGPMCIRRCYTQFQYAGPWCCPCGSMLGSKAVVPWFPYFTDLR